MENSVSYSLPHDQPNTSDGPDDTVHRTNSYSARDCLALETTNAVSACVSQPRPIDLCLQYDRCLIVIPFKSNQLRTLDQQGESRYVSLPAFSLSFFPENTISELQQTKATETLVVSVAAQRAAEVIHMAGVANGNQDKTVLCYRDQDIWMVAQSLRRYLLASQFESAIYLDSQADILLSHISFAIAQKSPSLTQKPSSLSESLLNDIFDHIEKGFRDTLTVSSVAAHFEIDLFQFSRAFKAQVGCTPQKFIIDRRISEARRLLVETNHPIAAIANDVGFCSQAHMTTAFRKVVTTTPGKYRREFTLQPSGQETSEI